MSDAVVAFFRALADLLDEGREPGAQAAARALRNSAPGPMPGPRTALDARFAAIRTAPDPLPSLRALLPVIDDLPWYIPCDGATPMPAEIGKGLRACELVGPDGTIHSGSLRAGLFVQAKDVPYGTRTHLAAELFITLAGRADWTCEDRLTCGLGPGGRQFHPSPARHSSATPDGPLLAAWVWTGDIGFDSYAYSSDV